MSETDNMGSQEMVAGVGGLRRVENHQEGEVDTRGLGGVELVVVGETGQQQEGLEHQIRKKVLQTLKIRGCGLCSGR